MSAPQTQDAILANIFIAIQAQLATIADLKEIAEDLMQLEMKDEKERPAVLLPCALISFPDIDYSDAGMNIQLAERAFVEVRLGIDPYLNASANYFSGTKIAASINYYNIEHRVNQALQGWCNNQYFTPLSRVKAKREGRNDRLRVRSLLYSFSFTDYTAMAVTTTTTGPDMVVSES